MFPKRPDTPFADIDQLRLTLEHRSAPAPDPVPLKLVSRPDGSATHLEVLGPPTVHGTPSSSLHDRLQALLAGTRQPLRRGVLRQRLQINNQRLGAALSELEAAGSVERTGAGWSLSPSRRSADRSRDDGAMLVS